MLITEPTRQGGAGRKKEDMKATIKVSNLEGKHTTAKVIYTDYGKGQILMTSHRKGHKSTRVLLYLPLNAKEYAEMTVQSMTEVGADWKLINVR